MNIDQKQIKFKGGKIEIKEMLKNGDDIEITMKGSIVSETASDNQDNSVNMIYQFKPLTIEVKDHEQDTEIKEEESIPLGDIPFGLY